MNTSFDLGAQPFIAISGLIGAGKCWAAGTEFLTFQGDSKTVEEVVPGDVLMGDDGTPRTVKSTTRGIGPMFRIVPHTNTTARPFECNDAHILVLKLEYKGDTVTHVDTEEDRQGNQAQFAVEYLKYDRQGNMFHLKTKSFFYEAESVDEQTEAKANAQKFIQKEKNAMSEFIWEVSVEDFLKSHPTVQRMARMYRKESVTFPEGRDAFHKLLHDACGYELTVDQIMQTSWLIGQWIAQDGEMDECMKKSVQSWESAINGKTSFTELMHILGILDEVTVPKIMQLDDIDKVRLPLLTGVMDTNGSTKFKHENMSLVNAVGRLANLSGLQSSLVYEEGTYSVVDISGENLQNMPFKKMHALPQEQPSQATWGFEVKPLSHGEYFGFMVDGNQRMLLWDLTVSHNSTLATELGKVMKLPVFYEPVAENAYLEDFYRDMSKYSFNLQIYLLNKRFQQHQQIIWSGTGGISDRSIYEDSIFAKLLADSGMMDQRDHETYKELFRNMSNFMRKPTLIVHLDVTPEESLERIKMRARDFETTVSVDYLRNLKKGYDEFLEDISKSIPVIRINYSKFRTAHEMAEVISREYEKLHSVRYVNFDKEESNSSVNGNGKVADENQ